MYGSARKRDQQITAIGLKDRVSSLLMSSTARRHSLVMLVGISIRDRCTFAAGGGGLLCDIYKPVAVVQQLAAGRLSRRHVRQVAAEDAIFALAVNLIQTRLSIAAGKRVRTTSCM